MNILKSAEAGCRRLLKSRALLCFVLIAAILPFLIISIWSRPSVDDFSYSAPVFRLIQSGDSNPLHVLAEAVRTDIDYYHNWQGLYSSAFLLALQPGIWGSSFYFIGALVLIALMYLGLHSLLAASLPRLEKSSHRLLAALTLFYFLQRMPSTVQGIYWFNGSWNYMFFFCMILFNLAAMVRCHRAGGLKEAVTITLLSFVISGGNHITGFLNILILTLALLVSRRRVLLAPGWLAAVIGFVIMFTAPGTAVRQDALESLSPALTVWFTAQHCYEMLPQWMDLSWFLMLCPVLLLAVRTAAEEEAPRTVQPLLLLLASLMLVCASFAVPAYALRNWGDLRCTNIQWLTFAVLSAWNVYNLAVRVLSSPALAWLPEHLRGLDPVPAIMVCLLLLTLIRSGNCHSVTAELLHGSAAAYAAAYDQRVEAMQSLAPGEILYTAPLPESENLNFDDVCDDISDWRNEAWKAYYGFDIIAR